MTIQEARQNVISCENRIQDSYNIFRNEVRDMGISVKKAATRKTVTCTLLPLIISLFGILLCFLSHPVWGVILIITGIVISYNIHKSMVWVKKSIENQVTTLNNTIVENIMI